MRLIIGRVGWQWRMYGLLGKGGLWFLGLSIADTTHDADSKMLEMDCHVERIEMIGGAE
jgi:hypothetical protein